MRKWSWLVAGLALSCSSTQRDFSPANNAGSSGRPPANGEAGAANGGAANGGAANGGTANGGAADGGAANGGTANGGAADGGAADGGAAAGEANESAAGDTGQEPSCKGCLIGKDCIQEGAQNPANRCLSCNPSIADDSYSPNVGANCGAGATACSGQDTCNASGACESNDFGSDVLCSGGACEAGVCKPQQNPFDCIAPSPPKVAFNAQVFGFTGTPPTAKGGIIADGRYTATRIDLYNSKAIGVDLRTFEFKKGFVQIASQYYTVDTQIAYIPEVRFSGSFTGSANLLKFELERCDPQYDIFVPNLPYTATANGMVTIVALADGTTIVTSYARQ